jgi:hypothetical protein
VAALFKTRIIPISAGTPQELAYAERAVRTIGEKSRAMLLGAPHLPNSLWGLADLHAGNVHDVLPQPERGNKSPFEIRKRKKPNIDHLHLKVFGCPCQFAPIDGPEHKRASKTEWGFYVGMQWPMCLVYQPASHKVLSVSRKKIVCHEGMYAYFDPAKSPIPNTRITEINTPRQPDVTNKVIEEGIAPTAVHSIKVLRDSQMHPTLNEALPQPMSLSLLIPSSQPENQGDNLDSILDNDSLLEKIEEIKKLTKEKAESQCHDSKLSC